MPNTFNKNQIGFFKGFYRTFDTSEAYYVTSEKVSKNHNKHCIGCINYSPKKSSHTNRTCLQLNTSNNKLSVVSKNMCTRNISFLTYDYNSFKNSPITETENCGIHFKVLSKELRSSNNVKNGRKHVFKFIVLQLIVVIDWLLKVCTAI